MEKREYRKYLTITKKMIYDDHDKTNSRWDFIEKNILYLIDNAPFTNEDAYLLYAKYNYERNFYSASIDSFLYVLDNYPQKRRQCLYGLIKSYIMAQNYYDAFSCLTSLKEKIVNIESDFGIVEALLAYLNDYDVDLEVDPSIYLYSKINDENVKTKYSLLLDSVIELDFNNAFVLAEELNIYSRQNKLEIDFMLLCELLNACIKKQKENTTLEFK